MAGRLFRSFTAVTGGKLEHERIRVRLEQFEGVKIRGAILQRRGGRLVGRLDAPSYDSRYVVEATGLAALALQSERSPYRGVSGGDLASYVEGLATTLLPITFATISFIARAFEPGPLEDLLVEIQRTAAEGGLELLAGVHKKDSAVLDSYELPARAVGDPAAVADLSDALVNTGMLRTWQIKSRWYEQRPSA